jgi:hypothetical protein
VEFYSYCVSGTYVRVIEIDNQVGYMEKRNIKFLNNFSILLKHHRLIAEVNFWILLWIVVETRQCKLSVSNLP